MREKTIKAKIIKKEFMNRNGCHDEVGAPIEYIVISCDCSLLAYATASKDMALIYNKQSVYSRTFFVDQTGIVQYTDYADGVRDNVLPNLKERVDEQGGYYFGQANDMNSIFIELLCNSKDGRYHTNDNSKYYISPKTMTTAVWLIRRLLAQYPHAKVIRRYDIDGFHSPDIKGWLEPGNDKIWIDFKDRCTPLKSRPVPKPDNDAYYRIMKEWINNTTFKKGFYDFDAAAKELYRFPECRVFNEDGMECAPLEETNYLVRLWKNATVYEENDPNSKVITTIKNKGVYKIIRRGMYRDRMMLFLEGSIGWIFESDTTEKLCE